MKHLIILLYTVLTLPFLLLSLPFLIILLPFREFKRRIGLARIIKDRYVWFHAASVGEVNALKPLLVGFRRKFPDNKILLTTMTRTGQETAEKITEIDFVTLIPLDFLPILALFMRKIQPHMIVIIETELWPALLYLADQKRIPVSIINGRISDYSYRRYKGTSFLFRPFYRSVELVGAQTENDARRFKDLGFINVRNTHNLKFCLDLPKYDPHKIRDEWGIKEDDFVMVWGSTRPGEEDLLKTMVPELQKRITSLKIIIAPRHLNRIEQITPLFRDFKTTLLSTLERGYDILIIDSMNILTKAYSVADLAIVGGSFCDFGGHNPLEPAFYSKPVIIGNFHSSCRHLVKTLFEGGGIIVSSRDKLLEDILQIEQNRELRITMGENARKIIEENSYSLQDNLIELTLILNKTLD